MTTAPFVFFDLRTADASAVRRFYTELFGWKIVDVPSGAGTAPMFVADDGPWGGLTQLAENDERKPQWIPYAPVADLDEAVRRATALGATLVRGRMDLPQGSLALITDPTGALVTLWQASETPASAR